VKPFYERAASGTHKTAKLKKMSLAIKKYYIPNKITKKYIHTLEKIRR